MCNKRGKKKMNATAPKIVNLAGFNSKRKKTKGKLNSLSAKDMKESMDFRRRSRDRD